MKFLSQTSILWLLLLTIQALWIGVITGLLSRTYTPLLGTLAMTSRFLMLKKILSTILHLTSFFTGKFKFFQDLPKIAIVLQGGFVISDLVFGCDNPTYNPSPIRELSLLTQFSGITTLQSLVLEKQCKGAWPSMVLSMRSDDLTSHITPVHPTFKCGKAEC